MKKISILFAMLAVFAMAVVTTGCEAGDEITNVINSYTTDKWYKCATAGSFTGTNTDDGSSVTFTETYLYYDSDASQLRVVAATNSFYAEKDFDFGAKRWAALSVAALESDPQKISKATNPRSSRTVISSDSLKEAVADVLVETLLGSLE